MDEAQDPSRAVDRTVGAALRTRRNKLRLSQADLGSVLGVTHQQVAKYESGADRLPVGRLALLADLLGRPVGWFFDPGNAAVPPLKAVALVPLEALLPDFAGDGLQARVSFSLEDGAAGPTIDVAALVDPASPRAVFHLPRALHPAMLRHGAAALLAAAEAGDLPLRSDPAPRAGAALN